MYTFKDSIETMIDVDNKRNELNKAKYNEIKIKSQQETSKILDTDCYISANISSTKDYLQSIHVLSIDDCVVENNNQLLIDINLILLYFKRSFSFLNNYDFLVAKLFVKFNDFSLAINIKLQKVFNTFNNESAKVEIDILIKDNNDDSVYCLANYETINSDSIVNSKEESCKIIVDNENLELIM